VVKGPGRGTGRSRNEEFVEEETRRGFRNRDPEKGQLKKKSNKDATEGPGRGFRVKNWNMVPVEG